jgi:GTP-binding protein
LLKLRDQLSEHKELVSMQLFSALKHTGHKELISVLDAWLTDASVYEDLE